MGVRGTGLLQVGRLDGLHPSSDGLHPSSDLRDFTGDEEHSGGSVTQGSIDIGLSFWWVFLGALEPWSLNFEDREVLPGPTLRKPTADRAAFIKSGPTMAACGCGACA